MGYIANYGYTDGSGAYYISIDSGKCNGCGDCLPACPQDIFELFTDDYDETIARVKEERRKELKYLCAPCKPVSGRKELPCLLACKPGALTHSW